MGDTVTHNLTYMSDVFELQMALAQGNVVRMRQLVILAGWSG